MIKLLGKGKAKLIVSIGSGKDRTRKTRVVEYSGKKELQKMYEAFENECRKKPLSGMSVNDLIEGYIKKRKIVGIKATTEVGYRTAQNRLIPFTDGFSAKNLTTYQLDKIIAQMVEKGYAPKTISNSISLLSAAYEDAIRTDLLEHNPCNNVTMPKRKKKEIHTFTEAEVWTFVGALQNERIDYKVGYELCLLCGMRRSEVLGLRASDVDLVNKCVSISTTRHLVDGKTVEQDTKTERSRRTLALPDILVDDIKELFSERSVFVWDKSDYLIQDGFGRPMNPSVFTNHIGAIEEQNGLPKVSVHGLRHTFASMLNAEGIDIARISAELGHSTITTTLNIYTHILGGASASSRGIADTLNRKAVKTATFLPPSEMKKASKC